MKCPYCEKDLPGKPCSKCGFVVPEGGQFCMHCGVPLREERETGSDQEDFDLDARILCPDGTCTGIIVNGKCTECGKPYPESRASDG
jgi:hypothetical protein